MNGFDPTFGAAGPLHRAGAVPDPGAVDGLNRVLSDTGTWVPSPPGPTGAAGAVGPAGADGTPGALGPTGAVGPTGAAGAVGAVGPGGIAGTPGAVGPTGASGAVGPGGCPCPAPVPYRPAGVTVNQGGCNIAGYLASDVIKASLQSALDSYSSSKTIVQAFATIVGLIPAIGVVIDVIAGGVYVLYQALTGGTVSNYTDALSDTKLWSDMTCAIYDAIRADGHVTDGNYGAVLANVRAVTYAHPDVVSAIGDFVAAIGASGMEHAQQVGALNAADCSGCAASGWCFRWVGANINNPIWTPDPNIGEGALEVTFGGGLAQSISVGGGQRLSLYKLWNSPAFLSTVRVVGTRGAAWDQGGYNGGSVQSGVGFALPNGQGAYDTTITINREASYIEVLSWTGASDAPNTISLVELRGTGAGPFGASNC